MAKHKLTELKNDIDSIVVKLDKAKGCLDEMLLWEQTNLPSAASEDEALAYASEAYHELHALLPKLPGQF